MQLTVFTFLFSICIPCKASNEVPIINSMFGYPIAESVDDVLILSMSHDVTFYFSGTNLNSIQEISLAYKKKPYGENCDDEKCRSPFEFVKINNYSLEAHRTIDLSFVGDSFYICISYAIDGRTEWVHQNLFYPSHIKFSSNFVAYHFSLCWLAFFVFLAMSALFSGLNLGIMTLDILSLDIMLKAGSSQEKMMASSVLPVRRHGNLVLCSLTMANVVVNVVISMLSDQLFGGTGIAIVGASVGILIFGEIIPQALCNRYSLQIAYRTILFTKCVLYITAPIAYPVSIMLDVIIGEDMGKTLNKAKLSELIKQHGNMGFVEKDEVNIITGALAMDKRTVKSIMTNIDDVYMISYTAELDYETTNDIIAHGYTRIPVYQEDRRKIKSVLNVKDLAFVDPNDKIPVSTICNFYKRPFIFVESTKTLSTMLKTFRKGSTHLAVVYDEEATKDKSGAVRPIGVVTLEDVIEEILQEEILDETDIYTDNTQRKKRSIRCPQMDLWPIINPRTGSKISPQLKIAALRHLIANVSQFDQKYIHQLVLQGFLNYSFTTSINYDDDDLNRNILYSTNHPSNLCIFTLQGALNVGIHSDRMSFDAGAFMMFGDDILTNVNEMFETMPDEWDLTNLLEMLGDKVEFVPDYTVRITDPVNYIELSAENYLVMRHISQVLTNFNIQKSTRYTLKLYEHFWKHRTEKGLKLHADMSKIWMTSETSYTEHRLTIRSPNPSDFDVDSQLDEEIN